MNGITGAGFILLLAALCTSCGYSVAGRGETLPKSLRTIAIPAFKNITTRYKLSDRLPEAISREFITRTRYRVVSDPTQADAVLTGAVNSYTSFPTVFPTWAKAFRLTRPIAFCAPIASRNSVNGCPSTSASSCARRGTRRATGSACALTPSASSTKART